MMEKCTKDTFQQAQEQKLRDFFGRVRARGLDPAGMFGITPEQANKIVEESASGDDE